jgi:hypothetical protein
MGKFNAREYFAQALYATGDAKSAFEATSVHVAILLQANLVEERGLETVLHDLGIRGPHIDTLCFVERDRGLDNVRRVIIDDPGSILDIPDPQCIQQNLPRGRKPTLDEIKRAVERCSK